MCVGLSYYKVWVYCGLLLLYCVALIVCLDVDLFNSVVIVRFFTVGVGICLYSWVGWFTDSWLLLVDWFCRFSCLITFVLLGWVLWVWCVCVLLLGGVFVWDLVGWWGGWFGSLGVVLV